MIEVYNIEMQKFLYRDGESTMTDENGWIYILDKDGLTIGAHPKDRVETVFIKAGEYGKPTGDN